MIILKKNNYTIYISEKKDWTAREISGFIYTKQTHGNSIYILENKIDFINSENDGIISEISNIKTWVLLADCNGIILMGKQRYGVVHAGRKGLQNGIINKALQILENKGEDMSTLQIYIWPSIRQCCYEVGSEFLKYFDKKFFEIRNEKLYFNMIANIIDICLENWIIDNNIEIHTACTACSWKFFSYRKNNNNQRIVVWIEKKNN